MKICLCTQKIPLFFLKITKNSLFFHPPPEPEKGRIPTHAQERGFKSSAVTSLSVAKLLRAACNNGNDYGSSWMCCKTFKYLTTTLLFAERDYPGRWQKLIRDPTVKIHWWFQIIIDGGRRWWAVCWLAETFCWSQSEALTGPGAGWRLWRAEHNVWENQRRGSNSTFLPRLWESPQLAAGVRAGHGVSELQTPR